MLKRSLSKQYVFGTMMGNTFVPESTDMHTLRMMGFAFIVKCAGAIYRGYVRSVRSGDCRALYMIMMADGQPSQLEERLVKEPLLHTYHKQAAMGVTTYIEGLTTMFEDLEDLGVNYDEAYKVAKLIKGIQEDVTCKSDVKLLLKSEIPPTWARCVLLFHKTAAKAGDMRDKRTSVNKGRGNAAQGQANATSDTKTKTIRPSDEPCRKMRDEGQCYRGDGCPYWHNKETEQERAKRHKAFLKSDASDAGEGRIRVRKAKTCPFFWGRLGWGYRCVLQSRRI